MNDKRSNALPFPLKVIVLRVVRLYLGNRRAVVAKPRLDMCSREALRYPEFKDRIELNKIRDHFICMSPFIPSPSLEKNIHCFSQYRKCWCCSS